MQIEHIFAFGKRQRFTYQATEALAQGVIQAFEMRRLPGLFADHLMCGRGQARVRAPQIAVTAALLIGGR